MQCFCANTRQAARLLTAVYEDALRPAHLTPSQFELLMTIDQRSPISQASLATVMALDSTTLSRNLKRLTLRSLLTRSRNSHDARVLLYTLSPEGISLRNQALPLWLRAHRCTEQRLGLHSTGVLAALKVLQSATATPTGPTQADAVP